MTREEAVRYFKRHIDLYCVEGICREAEEMAIKALEQEPKIGRWLKVSNGTLCSICRGYAIDDEGLVILTDYCPWCGAKMESEE